MPTPRGYVDPKDAPAGTYIVKPSREDAGIGIEAEAVVSTPKELVARCRHVVETYGQASPTSCGWYVQVKNGKFVPFPADGKPVQGKLIGASTVTTTTTTAAPAQ